MIVPSIAGFGPSGTSPGELRGFPRHPHLESDFTAAVATIRMRPQAFFDRTSIWVLPPPYVYFPMVSPGKSRDFISVAVVHPENRFVERHMSRPPFTG
jgi:hypothetical protein